MSSVIFISYRRGADSGFAGRLYDRLEASFGRQRVFMDVASVAPGEDFVDVLKSRIVGCDLLLALIGREWLAATDATAQRRLQNADDFVRIEIGAALAQGKRVIPVVIDDALMPRAEDLPDELKPLARRQAIRVTHERFSDDADHLVRTLEKTLGDAEAMGQAAQEAGTETRKKVRHETGTKRRTVQHEGRESKEEAKQWAAAARLKPPLSLRVVAGGATLVVALLAVVGLLAWEQVMDLKGSLERELTMEQQHEKVLIDLIKNRDVAQGNSDTTNQRANDDGGKGATAEMK